MTAAFQETLADAANTLALRIQETVVRVRSRNGSGSGILWRDDGQVITNHHVTPGDEAEIETHTGRRFRAHVEARDPANDLAVLVPDSPEEELPTATPGDSERLRVGQLVVAVGNPFGLKGVVTVGIISHAAPAREGERELVRANIVLQPGNSGGPLVDAEGRVVGVNAMVMGPGVGLAVPTQVVNRLLASSSTPKLGISGREVALGTLAAHAGIDEPNAVILTDVTAGLPAARAGLIPGDVIVGLNGQKVTAAREMAGALAARRSGDPIWFRVLRGGSLCEVVIPPLVAV
ncbi:MAG: trypsin-like peptidase domain-containing protein [Dehalococcoidia bacterium]